MNRYRIRRVGLRSLAGMGFALGVFCLLVPALLCGVLTRPLLAGARGVLEGWRSIPLGPSRVNLVEALGLKDVLLAVQALEAAGWWLAAAVVWVACGAAGLTVALVAACGGMGYNLLARLSGGVEVELGSAGEEAGDDIAD